MSDRLDSATRRCKRRYYRDRLTVSFPVVPIIIFLIKLFIDFIFPADNIPNLIIMFDVFYFQFFNLVIKHPNFRFEILHLFL